MHNAVSSDVEAEVEAGRSGTFAVEAAVKMEAVFRILVEAEVEAEAVFKILVEAEARADTVEAEVEVLKASISIHICYHKQLHWVLVFGL